MIKKLMQLRNTIVALLGIEFVLALLTYMFLQNRVTLALTRTWYSYRREEIT